MRVLYVPSRRHVKNNLGYIILRSISRSKRQLVSHNRPILLATDTRLEPTVFDTVIRTYLACCQGNFGLAPGIGRPPTRRVGARGVRPRTGPSAARPPR